MNGRSQRQGGKKLDFAGRDKCKQVLLRLSLVGYLEKPLITLYGTEWRERGYGTRIWTQSAFLTKPHTVLQQDGLHAFVPS
jgi:hypothetical protein